jgi:hypothetical protein
VYISATYLSSAWKTVPADELASALFFFGSKRSWLFPATDAERRDRDEQPTDYAAFSKEFLALVLEKEKAGLCHFLKPDCSYANVSTWLESIDDPLRPGHKYAALKLDPAWWRANHKTGTSKHGAGAERVIINFQTGEHDYSGTMELLAQSNPTLKPVLQPHKSGGGMFGF